MSDDAQEYALRSLLRWRRDGKDWLLFFNRRRLGRVVPDLQFPGLYRSEKSAGRRSDQANLSWTKDSVMAGALRELSWERARKSAVQLAPTVPLPSTATDRILSGDLYSTITTLSSVQSVAKTSGAVASPQLDQRRP
jgi:hypothetical protein